MEQCLALDTLGEPLNTLELVLYIPWMIFFATWLLSFVHYDLAIFVTTSLVNYVLYGFFFAAAQAIGWRSALAKPCDSFLYNIYEFQWPSASLVAWLTNTFLLVLYHVQRRHDWWFVVANRSKWTWHYKALLGITILAPPAAFIAFLLLSGIQSIGALILNVLLSLALLALLWAIVPGYPTADALIHLVHELYF